MRVGVSDNQSVCMGWMWIGRCCVRTGVRLLLLAVLTSVKSFSLGSFDTIFLGWVLYLDGYIETERNGMTWRMRPEIGQSADAGPRHWNGAEPITWRYDPSRANQVRGWEIGSRAWLAEWAENREAG